ncbi:MAG: DUF2769 domain-containing protein [Parcubacteria group bacterium]|jgi:hypothetical protein
MAKVPVTPENETKCACPRCPTWMSDSCPKEKGENLFCAKGKTACELPDKGCICGTCPIWTEYGLSKGYFCFNGVAE